MGIFLFLFIQACELWIPGVRRFQVDESGVL